MLNEKGLEAASFALNTEWNRLKAADPKLLARAAITAYLAASPEAPEDVAGVEPVAWRYADDVSGIRHYVEGNEPLKREVCEPLYPASALARVAAEVATLRARIAELEGKVERPRKAA